MLVAMAALGVAGEGCWLDLAALLLVHKFGLLSEGLEQGPLGHNKMAQTGVIQF